MSRFEGKVDEMDESQLGWAAVEAALARRTELVLATPDLARVVFSEEQFQGDKEIAQLLYGMM